MILNRLAAEMKGKLRPEELAAKTGLSFNTVVKAMKGKDVSAGTAELIAHAMKRKREDLC